MKLYLKSLWKPFIILLATAPLTSCQIGAKITVKTLVDGNTLFIINRDDGEKSCVEGVRVTELNNTAVWELSENKLPLVKGAEMCQNYLVYAQSVYNFTTDVPAQKLQIGKKYRVSITGDLFSDEVVFVAGK